MSLRPTSVCACVILVLLLLGACTQSEHGSGASLGAPTEIHAAGYSGRWTKQGIGSFSRLNMPISRIRIWYKGRVQAIQFTHRLSNGSTRDGTRLGIASGNPSVDIHLKPSEALISVEAYGDSKGIKEIKFTRVEIDRTNALSSPDPRPDIQTGGWKYIPYVNIRYDVMEVGWFGYPFSEIVGLYGTKDPNSNYVAGIGFVRKPTPPFIGGGAGNISAAAKPMYIGPIGSPLPNSLGNVNNQDQFAMGAKNKDIWITSIETWQDEKTGGIVGIQVKYNRGRPVGSGTQKGKRYVVTLSRTNQISSVVGHMHEKGYINKLQIFYRNNGVGKLTKMVPTPPYHIQAQSMYSGTTDMVNEVMAIQGVWGGKYLTGILLRFHPTTNHVAIDIPHD